MNRCSHEQVLKGVILCLALSAVAAHADITFHGRVLDNHDTPVEGAYVTAQLFPAGEENQPQRQVVQTDRQGAFTIQGPGDTLEILSIRKKEYFFFKKDSEQFTYHYNRPPTAG